MFLDSFLNYIQYEKRYSKHTSDCYRLDITQFSKYIKEEYELEKLVEVKHLHIRSWVVNLVTKGLSAKSINRKISSLKSFYKYLKKKEEITLNPTNKIIAPKLSKRLPKFIQTENLERLFTYEEAFGDNFQGLRDRLIMELLYSTGMRRSELINLKDRDVDFHKNQIKVLGKGNKERVIPIHQKLLSLLKEYKVSRDTEFSNLKEDWLILTNSGKPCYPKFIYNKVVKYLSIVTTSKDKSPHVLRHSFATHLTDQGAELNAVKTLLGHSSLAATQVYTHNSIEKLKKVYEKAHPKA